MKVLKYQTSHSPCMLIISIKVWWKGVFWLKFESHFSNLRTSHKQPKILQLNHISASKTQNKQTKMSHGCHYDIYWSHGNKYRLVSYSSLFPHSFHLHHLLPMILHESGSQQYRVFMITGPRYVNLIPF